jgi:competence protein ComEC
MAPLLKPYFDRLPQQGGIAEMLCLTCAAQMLASPWILYLFGQLSVIAPVSNLIAPPLVPYATLAGVVSILAGSVWMPLGQLAAALTWLPLQGIISSARLLSSIPLASLSLPGLPTLAIVLYYAAIVAWITTRNAGLSFSLRPREASSPAQAACAGTETHAR